jgi:hypothetical protein
MLRRNARTIKMPRYGFPGGLVSAPAIEFGAKMWCVASVKKTASGLRYATIWRMPLLTKAHGLSAHIVHSHHLQDRRFSSISLHIRWPWTSFYCGNCAKYRHCGLPCAIVARLIVVHSRRFPDPLIKASSTARISTGLSRTSYRRAQHPVRMYSQSFRRSHHCFARDRAHAEFLMDRRAARLVSLCFPSSLLFAACTSGTSGYLPRHATASLLR